MGVHLLEERIMNKQEVLKALIGLKEHVPETRIGICSNIGCILDYRVDDWIDQRVVKWGKFSGNKTWPVPCPKNGSPKEAFCCTPNLWTGKYGKLRYELLDFLIEELTKEIEEEKGYA